MDLPISLEHLTVAPADPCQLLDIAATLGCPMVVVSVRATPGYTSPYDLVAHPEQVRDTARKATATGVAIRAVSSVRLIPDFDLDEVVRIMEVGAKLDARNVLVTGYDPDPLRTEDRFLQVCQRAGACGLGVILEPVSYSEINTLGRAAALAALAKSARVGLLVDVLHLYRSGGTVADIRAIDPGLILHAQISDGPLRLDADKRIDESRWRRAIPGEGALPMLEFLRALPPGTPVGMEVPLKDLSDRGTSALERARLVFDATRRLVEAA